MMAKHVLVRARDLCRAALSARLKSPHLWRNTQIRGHSSVADEINAELQDLLGSFDQPVNIPSADSVSNDVPWQQEIEDPHIISAPSKNIQRSSGTVGRQHATDGSARTAACDYLLASTVHQFATNIFDELGDHFSESIYHRALEVCAACLAAQCP